MRYSYIDLIALEKILPGLLQKVNTTGKFNAAHTAVDLPDDFDFQGHEPKQIVRGLGDHVKLLASPFVGAVKALTGIDLSECGGCKERQEKLNKAFPSD